MVFAPATVPCTIVPFFSSMVTVSLLSFIRNLSNTKEGATKIQNKRWEKMTRNKEFRECHVWRSRVPTTCRVISAQSGEISAAELGAASILQRVRHQAKIKSTQLD